VCRALFQELAVQRKQPFGSCFLEGGQIEQFVKQNLASAPGPTVIKAHMIGPAALMALRAGKVKAVCTFRDPRDCVASDLVFLNSGLETSLKHVTASKDFLKYYQSNSNILLVKYEDMMADRLGQIRRIATHLNVPFDDALITRVDAKTNIESSKKVCRELASRSPEKLLSYASHRVDPETHLHENHIGTAKVGRWREEFSFDQALWLTEYFSSWLLQLGYETQQSLHAAITSRAPVASVTTPPQQAYNNISQVVSPQGRFSTAV